MINSMATINVVVISGTVTTMKRFKGGVLYLTISHNVGGAYNHFMCVTKNEVLAEYIESEISLRDRVLVKGTLTGWKVRDYKWKIAAIRMDQITALSRGVGDAHDPEDVPEVDNEE